MVPKNNGVKLSITAETNRAAEILAAVIGPRTTAIVLIPVSLSPMASGIPFATSRPRFARNARTMLTTEKRTDRIRASGRPIFSATRGLVGLFTRSVDRS